MKARHFFLLAVALFGLSIFALRNNNVTAYNMRALVIERDASGEAIEEQLQELQEYVFTHMNTSMSLTLEGRYQRALKAAELSADRDFDADIYAKAQAACDRQGVLTRDNAKCVQDYLEKRLDRTQEAKLPTREQYTYVFIAPTWTTDLAGFALLGAIISVIGGTFAYAKQWWSRIPGFWRK